MRDDVLIRDVLDKCEALKKATLWAGEPKIRPRAWLNNFDAEDRGVAAALLDRFNFYDARATDALLLAAYQALGDGLNKGPAAPAKPELLAAVSDAVFTPVRGEDPNPTDSGNVFSRKVRQQLSVPEHRIVDFSEALVHARQGRPVIFVDDFIGTGDQFIATWTMAPNGTSFASLHANPGFIAIYVVLVATRSGMESIHRLHPAVAISPAHVLEKRSTLRGLYAERPDLEQPIEELLTKYSSRLTPEDDVIAGNPLNIRYGFKQKGLLFAFDHSVPDSTLPIFWSSGINNWSPLIERS